MTFVVVGFFVLILIVFLAVAFIYPEWVGIQGKVAKSIQQQHKQDSEQEKKP